MGHHARTPLEIEQRIIRGREIRTWREGNDWSRRTLARKCKVSKASVQGWEEGDSAPSQESMSRLHDLGFVSSIQEEVIAHHRGGLILCSHSRTKRGDDIPRAWGSWQTEVCVPCGAFRTRSHCPSDPRIGPWRPAGEYAAATAPIEDE